MASEPRARELFAAAGITAVEDVVQRSARVQQLALQGDAKRPYACVLRAAFLVPRVTEHPAYAGILAREGRGRILDLGCCMGTDLRQMLLDGACRELTCGVDFSRDFIRLGFELFGDKDALVGSFQCVDILEGWSVEQCSISEGWRLPGGPEGCTARHKEVTRPAAGWVFDHAASFDVVHSGAFLHTFESKEEVREVLRRIFWLLSPGGVVFGSNRPMWVHTAESLRAELEDVGFEAMEVMQRPEPGEKHAEDLFWKTADQSAGLKQMGRGTHFVARKPARFKS